ncbi:hypothetical protein GCM10007981_01730 [Thermocladium modestius]|uniref:Restriction endonuclease type IV Mrr domain-containing protein n=1 Tax=Thermocladium modestius TaxID=62609 RepID=A0A830GVK7_9CREN|nr:hypothetical protein GCM10007981_01730 [Thermocladium modestius]
MRHRFVEALFKLTSESNTVFSIESILNESLLDEEEVMSVLNTLGSEASRIGNYWKLTVPRLFAALELDPSCIGNLIDSIDWREFEGLVAFILGRWGYRTMNNVRLRLGGQLMEIDVVGIKGDRVVLVEAKRWRRNAMKGVVEAHLRKAEAMRNDWMKVARKLGLPLSEARIYPVVVSWKREEGSFALPVVDITSLNGLASALDSTPDALPSLRASMNSLDL